MKFSIVIPCYNCEPWVKECIDSVKAQAGDWECIIRIEASTDKTAEVVRQEIAGTDGFDDTGRSLQDPRFILLNGQPSGGPSVSRNAGIQRATGDYIIFLDSDDLLAPNAIATLEPLLQNAPDIATIAIDWDGKPRDTWDGIQGPLTGGEATVRLAEKQPFPLAMAQQYLFRTEFLRKEKLLFVESLKHEDEEFYPRALYKATSVLPLHLPLYLYRIREGSMTTASKERDVSAIARVLLSHLAFFRESNASVAVNRAWARTWLTMFFYTFFHPKYSSATPNAKTRKALRTLFGKETRDDFRALATFASRPKRLGVTMARFSAKTGILWPTRLFFRLYYCFAR